MPARPVSVGLDADGVIDLDARRAARLDAVGGTKKVRFGGKVWDFKVELPLTVVENFSTGDVKGAFEKILANPKDAADFMKHDVSQNDFQALLESVYGLSLPNS